MLTIADYIVYVWLIPVTITIVVPLTIAFVWVPVRMIRSFVLARSDRPSRSTSLPPLLSKFGSTL
jgi:hypothetical protein